MKAWHLVAPKELKEFNYNDLPPKPGEAKIKMFNVLMHSFDSLVYSGGTSAAFPLIPGRFGVGKVVAVDEKNRFGIRKGQQVFIDPVFPDKNFSGDSTPLMGLESMKYAGQTRDGFAVPMVNARLENLYPLPASVRTESALYTYLIALAKSALEQIKDVRGKYIAVIGANALGILICQLLLYYQAVPVLIDNRTSRLEFAKQCGVTYAFLNDEGLDSHINSITGAAFMDGTIYASTGSTTVNSAVFRVTAPEKTVVFCGYAPQSLQVDLKLALTKELRLVGVSQASENISTAINLLANKAVDVSSFPQRTYALNDLGRAYAESETYMSNSNRGLNIFIIDCYGKL